MLLLYIGIYYSRSVDQLEIESSEKQETKQNKKQLLNEETIELLIHSFEKTSRRRRRRRKPGE